MLSTTLLELKKCVKALETEQQHDYVGYYYVRRKPKRANSEAELGKNTEWTWFSSQAIKTIPI